MITHMLTDIIPHNYYKTYDNTHAKTHDNIHGNTNEKIAHMIGNKMLVVVEVYVSELLPFLMINVAFLRERTHI